MKYQIVESYRFAKLENKVNILIEAGWIPQGGIAVDNYLDTHRYYFQAMIKK